MKWSGRKYFPSWAKYCETAENWGSWERWKSLVWLNAQFGRESRSKRGSRYTGWIYSYIFNIIIYYLYILCYLNRGFWTFQWKADRKFTSNTMDVSNILIPSCTTNILIFSHFFRKFLLFLPFPDVRVTVPIPQLLRCGYSIYPQTLYQYLSPTIKYPEFWDRRSFQQWKLLSSHLAAFFKGKNNPVYHRIRCSSAKYN